ncbi:hypothetical protein SOCEGT47_063030 [Sorangium cellulosum]|uniref:Uncharacterized protein n=1 Tax=Sorangium cellulosum TaxID=56 RepID=A0A4V0NED1_SORCE|nr:hypothetical protein [Sorangium cellulosum]AUX25752.1 hypothetical protein SOCEGT47_063030 [Sorangium cellulosum]
MDVPKPRKAVVPGAPPVPVVIVAGCPAELVAACRDAGARLGVAVREADLRSLRAVVGASRPYAVLVMEDLYRFDPALFDAIARKAPASLVRLEHREAHDPEVRRLLIEAIFESAATDAGIKVRPLRR